MGEYDRVELVAMQHHQLAAVCRLVEGRALDLDPAEMQPAELAEHLVMVAGDIHDARAALGALQYAPDDVVMRRRPVELLLQPPAIDDVTHEIHRLAVDIVEEVDQQLGIAALCAKAHVADPDGAEPAPFTARLFRHGWLVRIEVGQRGRAVTVAEIAFDIIAKHGPIAPKTAFLASGLWRAIATRESRFRGRTATM